MQQDDSLPDSLDSNNNGIPLLKSNSLQDVGFLTNPMKHPLNQAYLNELRLGIHDWKRSIEVYLSQSLRFMLKKYEYDNAEIFNIMFLILTGPRLRLRKRMRWVDAKR